MSEVYSPHKDHTAMVVEGLLRRRKLGSIYLNDVRFLEARIRDLEEQLEARDLALVIANGQLADLREQLESLQREVESYEALCHRCDSSVGIEQALERGEENWCDVCWDTPIIRRRASTPATKPSGERVAAGMPSSTSESSGANQSPEESSPSRDRAVIDGGEESHASPLDPA